MATILQVGGMTCEHCVRAVTKTLQAVPGVDDVSVTLAGGRALVEGTADPQALVHAIEKEGYEANLVGAQ
jgi:copper chaperone